MAVFRLIGSEFYRQSACSVHNRLISSPLLRRKLTMPTFTTLRTTWSSFLPTRCCRGGRILRFILGTLSRTTWRPIVRLWSSNVVRLNASLKRTPDPRFNIFVVFVLRFRAFVWRSTGNPWSSASAYAPFRTFDSIRSRHDFLSWIFQLLLYASLDFTFISRL